MKTWKNWIEKLFPFKGKIFSPLCRISFLTHTSSLIPSSLLCFSPGVNFRWHGMILSFGFCLLRTLKRKPREINWQTVKWKSYCIHLGCIWTGGGRYLAIFSLNPDLCHLLRLWVVVEVSVQGWFLSTYRVLVSHTHFLFKCVRTHGADACSSFTPEVTEAIHWGGHSEIAKSHSHLERDKHKVVWLRACDSTLWPVACKAFVF